MIITKDLCIMANSDFPNTDWTGNALYVIPQNSELANKLINSSIDKLIFIEDNEGNLIDIKEKDLTIEELREKKIEELYQACNKLIEAGIEHKDKHYSLSSDNQMNLIRNFGMAQMGLSVFYQADGEGISLYNSDEFIELYYMAFSYIAEQMNKFNTLKLQVLALESADIIKDLYFI